MEKKTVIVILLDEKEYAIIINSLRRIKNPDAKKVLNDILNIKKREIK